MKVFPKVPRVEVFEAVAQPKRREILRLLADLHEFLEAVLPLAVRRVKWGRRRALAEVVEHEVRIAAPPETGEFVEYYLGQLERVA